MKLDREVKREIYKIAVGSAYCTALVVAVFLLLRRFDHTVAIGAVIGYLLAVGNFFFMSLGITNAIATGDEAAAKLKLRASYISRTLVMLLVVAASLVLDFINPIPVLVAVFYPQIIITVMNFWNTYVLKKGAGDPVPEALPEDEGEEETDEFEKFVSKFSKGPIPGEEKKNEDENKAE